MAAGVLFLGYDFIHNSDSIVLVSYLRHFRYEYQGVRIVILFRLFGYIIEMKQRMVALSFFHFENGR